MIHRLESTLQKNKKVQFLSVPPPPSPLPQLAHMRLTTRSWRQQWGLRET